MEGFSEGFYDDSHRLDDDTCFSDDAISSIYNIFEGFNHGRGWLDTTFRVSTAMWVFFVNLQLNCQMYMFFYDSATYCFRSSQCDSLDIYIYNLGVNLVPISLYTLQLILTVFVNWNTNSISEIIFKYRTIGKLVSQIFTSLVDMHS